MKDILIRELQHYTNSDLDNKTLKELLDMYNELFNKEYYYQQLENASIKKGAFNWE